MLCLKWGRGRRRVRVAGDETQHILDTTHLPQHTSLAGPAHGFTAADADVGLIVLLQSWVQDLHEVGSLGAGGSHGGVRGPRMVSLRGRGDQLGI